MVSPVISYSGNSIYGRSLSARDVRSACQALLYALGWAQAAQFAVSPEQLPPSPSVTPAMTSTICTPDP